jgi:quercetin dioxygenase-like cupin family protein
VTSPARADRPDAGPFVHVRLTEAAARLQTEPAWIDGDRNAITLTKQAGLTLVLTALRRGAVLREHHAPAPTTVHVVSGRMAFRAGDRTLTLTAGDVVTMEAGLPHAGEALEDTAFLLTIAVQ